MFVVDGNKAKLRKVETGIQDNTYIQILSGLTEGDEVVTGPYRAVSKSLKKNDDTIEKVDEEKNFLSKR